MTTELPIRNGAIEASKSPVSRDLSEAARADDLVFEFCRSPHRFLIDLALSESPIARFRINDESFAVVSSPELFRAVMTGSLEDFEKGPLYDILRMTFGDGVFTADGQVWRNQQAVVAPHFSRSRIGGLSGTIGGLIDRQLDRWERLPSNATIDMLAETKRLAFDVVRIGLLGISNPVLSDELREALNQIDHVDGIRVYYLSRRLIGLRGTVRKTPLFDRLDRVIYAIVEERLVSPGESDDMVGATIRGPGFAELAPDSQRKVLRDLIASMMAAGYISTGEVLFWALHLLARHPEVQARARTEIHSSIAMKEAGDSVPANRSSFASLRYLSAVLNETLRLYPPAWFIGRTAKRSLQLGTVHIPAGTRVICSPFVLHRLPALWPNPEEFRPERFLPGASFAPTAYVPYSVGSRACLGRSLAAMELSSLTGAVLSRFEVQLASPQPVSLAAAFSIRPVERVQFRLQRL